MEIKGKPIAIRHIGILEILLSSQTEAIKSEKENTSNPLPIPNKIEKKQQVLTALKA